MELNDSASERLREREREREREANVAYMAQDRNKKKSFSVLYDDEQRPLHTLQIYI